MTRTQIYITHYMEHQTKWQTANYLNTINQRKIIIHVDQSYEAISLDHEGFRIEDPVRKWAFYVFSWWTGELFLHGWSQVSKYSPSETPGHFRLIFRFTFGGETRWQVVQDWWKRRPAGFQPAAGSLLESSPFVKLWICDPLSECETLHQRSELSATFSRLLSPFFARNYNLNSIPGCECLEKLAHLAQNR